MNIKDIKEVSDYTNKRKELLAKIRIDYFRGVEERKKEIAILTEMNRIYERIYHESCDGIHEINFVLTSNSYVVDNSNEVISKLTSDGYNVSISKVDKGDGYSDNILNVSW